jgi:hypothetical protein
MPKVNTKTQHNGFVSIPIKHEEKIQKGIIGHQMFNLLDADVARGEQVFLFHQKKPSNVTF